MIRKKSVLVLITIVALILLLLSQCTGTGKQSTPPGDHGTVGSRSGKNTVSDPGSTGRPLRIVVSMEPGQFTALLKLSNAYSDAHGGMTIQLENIPRKDAYTAYKKASQLGESADLMLLDNNWVNEFAALGYLQPVDEWFTSEMQQQRIPVALNQVKWNGYLWGIPYDVDPYLLAWNKRSAEVVKRDHAPETTEEMISWQQSLTKQEEGRYGIYYNFDSPEDFIAVSSALTGAWLDPNQTDKKWSDPASIKTVESFLLPQDGSVKSIARSFPSASAAFDPWEQLQKGKIAAIVTTFSSYRSHTFDSVGIASLPHTYTDNKGNYVWLTGRSFGLSPRSMNQKAAMDWVKDITSQESSVKMWTDSKLLPALLTALSSGQIRNDEYYKSYEWLLNHAVVLQPHPETYKKVAAVQTELQKLFKAEQDVKSFSDQMAKLWVPSKKP